MPRRRPLPESGCKCLQIEEVLWPAGGSLVADEILARDELRPHTAHLYAASVGPPRLEPTGVDGLGLIVPGRWSPHHDHPTGVREIFECQLGQRPGEGLEPAATVGSWPRLHRRRYRGPSYSEARRGRRPPIL